MSTTNSFTCIVVSDWKLRCTRWCNSIFEFIGKGENARYGIPPDCLRLLPKNLLDGYIGYETPENVRLKWQNEWDKLWPVYTEYLLDEMEGDWIWYVKKLSVDKNGNGLVPVTGLDFEPTNVCGKIVYAFGPDLDWHETEIRKPFLVVRVYMCIQERDPSERLETNRVNEKYTDVSIICF